jgi:hypothetical protein
MCFNLTFSHLLLSSKLSETKILEVGKGAEQERGKENNYNAPSISCNTME